MVDDWSSSNETDGRDEIICSIDLDWDNPLRDNELGKYFTRVPKDCQTLVILDSCHSGTGLRNGFGPIEVESSDDYINRFISPPLSNILSNPATIIKDDLSFSFPEPSVDTRGRKSNFLIDAANQGDAILISGCQDDQTSADAWLNNKYGGAMTCMLANVLQENDFDISYKNLVVKMNKKLDKYRFTQNPQLECSGEFFNDKFLK